MELSDLRYFVDIAHHQSLTLAARKSGVSVAALSKSVKRLEKELEATVLVRSGRYIKLAPAGLELQAYAIKMLRLEAEIRSVIGGLEATRRLVFCGLETHLSKIGIALFARYSQKYPMVAFEALVANDQSSKELLASGRADVGIITSQVSSGLSGRIVRESSFQICASTQHPLFKEQTRRKFSIAEIVKFPFATFDSPLLGNLAGQEFANDGWDDRRYPRIKKVIAPSLKMIEESLRAGIALAYLPDYVSETLPDVRLIQVHDAKVVRTQILSLVVHSRNKDLLNALV